MRWVFCAVLVLGLTSPATAADLDILRGPQIPATPPLTVGPATFTRWSGFYAGGDVGYGNANADFSGATQSLVAFVLRDTTLQAEDAPSQRPTRHARAWPEHPRLRFRATERKSWILATGARMTVRCIAASRPASERSEP